MPPEPAADRAPDVDLDALRIHRDAEPTHASDRSGGGRSAPRRWPFVLILLLLLGGVGVAAYTGDRKTRGSEARVRVERVPEWAPRAVVEAKGFSAAGWVKLPRYHPVHVTPLVEGRVEEIAVIEGDRVVKGQVLARLYRRDYQAHFDVTEAAVRAARAAHEKMAAGYRTQEVAEAKAEVERLQAELEIAEDILARSRELEPTGAIPLEELQVDRAKVEALRASLAKGRERLALLVEGYRKEDVELAAASLAKAEAERDLAKLRLGYTEILSPMDGVVLERYAARGQWLKPYDGIVLDLFDPTDLEARVDVNQDAVSRVYVGQDVEITTRAEQGRIQAGKVTLIEPKADLVKNTVPVRVKLSGLDGEGLIYPDMVVTARFLTKPRDPAEAGKRPEITISATAVLEGDGNQDAVFVVESGVLRRRVVVLGEARNDRFVVTKGLEGGESVVVNPLSGFTEGLTVDVTD